MTRRLLRSISPPASLHPVNATECPRCVAPSRSHSLPRDSLAAPAKHWHISAKPSPPERRRLMRFVTSARTSSACLRTPTRSFRSSSKKKTQESVSRVTLLVRAPSTIPAFDRHEEGFCVKRSESMFLLFQYSPRLQRLCMQRRKTAGQVIH